MEETKESIDPAEITLFRIRGIVWNEYRNKEFAINLKKLLSQQVFLSLNRFIDHLIVQATSGWSLSRDCAPAAHVSQSLIWSFLPSLSRNNLQKLRGLIQQILCDQQWQERLTKEDYRALLPLIYSNTDPYGVFELYMAERAIEQVA